jgi:hypothetical protein
MMLRTPPKLLVLYDDSVNRTGTNPLILYRLLRDYPPDLLRIVSHPSDTDDDALRLPNVEYHAFTLGKIWFERFPFNNRFLRPFWPHHLARKAQRSASRVLELLGDFRPEAVVSVASGYLWFTADAIGQRTDIPVHLFLHEDWPYHVTKNRKGVSWKCAQWLARRMIQPVFQRATSRFSVSPGMAEELARTYKVDSEIMYPNRGGDSPTPVVRVRADRSSPLVIAHCGYVQLPGNAALLRDIAAIARLAGGHLDMYTRHSDAALAGFGLVPPVVRRVGFFPATEMADRISTTAQVLFLSASFDPADRLHEATLFPSKLADYTAVGLPIVIWGPGYSSAARWASANAGAALLFTERDPRPVGDAILRVAADSELARARATVSVAAGIKYFELGVAKNQFFGALTRKD